MGSCWWTYFLRFSCNFSKFGLKALLSTGCPRAEDSAIFKDLRLRGQGLDLRGQGQGRPRGLLLWLKCIQALTKVNSTWPEHSLSKCWQKVLCPTSWKTHFLIILSRKSKSMNGLKFLILSVSTFSLVIKGVPDIGVAKIFDLGGPKPQITCNDVIRNFQKRNFWWGQRYRGMENLKP